LYTVVVAPAPPLVVVAVYVAAAVREVIAAPDVVELDALNCLAAAPTGVGFPSFCIVSPYVSTCEPGLVQLTDSAETVEATSVASLTHETSWRPISSPRQQNRTFAVVEFQRVQVLSAQKGMARRAAVQSASVNLRYVRGFDG